MGSCCNHLLHRAATFQSIATTPVGTFISDGNGAPVATIFIRRGTHLADQPFNPNQLLTGKPHRHAIYCLCRLPVQQQQRRHLRFHGFPFILSRRPPFSTGKSITALLLLPGCLSIAGNKKTREDGHHREHVATPAQLPSLSVSFINRPQVLFLFCWAASPEKQGEHPPVLFLRRQRWWSPEMVTTTLGDSPFI